MANDLTGLIWQCASDGILSYKPVYIRKILFYPNAKTDVATLHMWGPETANATARTEMRGKSIQCTGSDTVISAGNFEASEAVAGDVIHFLDFDGRTSVNFNIWAQIETVNADDNIVVDAEDGVTTEGAGAIASWDVWAPSVAFPIYAHELEKQMLQYDFGPRGFRVPNLKLDALTASAVVYIYIA